MINTIEEFNKNWESESNNTLKLLKSLTNASLNQKVWEEGRTLGEIAWHIVNTIPEMSNHSDLKIFESVITDEIKKDTQTLVNSYIEVSQSLLKEAESKWNNDCLVEEVDMYGEKWSKGMILQAVIAHEIHHRGQMTILMRQANLKVPGMYGPSKEEWEIYGMSPQK